MSRILSLVVLTILLGGQADGPKPEPALRPLLFKDAKTGEIAVGFEFAVKDVSAVEENKKFAESLLPAAKILAEATKARIIAIRAKQTTGVIGPSTTSIAYGYTWVKDPTTDAWVEHEKKTP